jgi:hypothetical protein
VSIHSYEDIAKSGYKIENKIKIWPNLFFPYYLWRLKISKITSFSIFLIFNFAFWRNFASKKEGGGGLGQVLEIAPNQTIPGINPGIKVDNHDH